MNDPISGNFKLYFNPKWFWSDRLKEWDAGRAGVGVSVGGLCATGVALDRDPGCEGVVCVGALSA